MAKDLQPAGAGTTAPAALEAEGPPRSRRERFSAFLADQVPISRLALVVGGLALALVLPGTLIYFIAGGLTPYDKLLETATSDGLANLMWTGMTLGFAAAVVGFGRYRAMPTKPAREAAVSGAVLGLQAVLYSGFFLWFITGENFDLFVRQNFSLDLLSDFTGAFVRGAVNTVILALAGEGLGIVIGLLLAMLILSNRVVVRAPARVYINFFRGTPLIWQLSFFYAAIALGLRSITDVYQIAILVLGLNAGAYSAEVFRAGIQSIERGQIEAARSLGMSYLQAMRYAVLPQAIRRVIPPLTNEFIILIKDTSLVFILGLFAGQRELFSVGRDAYAERFNATFFLGTAAGYLAITLPMIRVVTWLERKLRSGLTSIIG